MRTCPSAPRLASGPVRAQGVLVATLTVAQLPGEVVAVLGAVAQQLPGVGAVPLPSAPPQQGVEPEHQVEA